MKRIVILGFAVLSGCFVAVSGCDGSAKKKAELQTNLTPKAGEPTPFNFIFRYGVRAKNELDTFDKTYTKDMVMGPPVKIIMSLSKEELTRIYQKMLEINFFDYPDKFFITVPIGEPIGEVTPYSSYYFKVVYDSKIKELSWDDYILNKSEKADKLRELIRYIKNIIESKPEYKKLPQPKGGYI